MSKRISLSRAARLVGVKRGTLQQKIRAGELKTFEGDIVLSDLLQAYPDARIEDSSMLDRVEQIIEQASFINADAIQHKPDKAALAARVMSLSRTLTQEKRRNRKYRELLADMQARLKSPEQRENPDMSALADWLRQACDIIDKDDATIDQHYANEVFLRAMTAQATVIPSGHEFFVEGAESILEAGLRGGLALNYGCSSGNCGLCKIRVVSGETSKIKHHDYVLSEAEKGMGYVLSCSHTAVSDVVLEAEEASSVADIPRQEIPVKIKKVSRPNDEMLILNARTPRSRRLRFLAGQRASLSIDQVGSGLYPIASCPCDDMNLQFHIPINPRDPVASYLLDSAKVNDLLTLEGPSGSFVLDENSPNPLVFIAQGSGFASVKGLIEHAMALDIAEQVYLFWIAQADSSPYLGNLCRAWNDALDNFVYVPLDAASGEQLASHISAHLAQSDPARFDYYLCSGEAIKMQMEQFAEKLSLPKAQLKYEPI